MKAEIEHYAQRDSLIHRWDARWKLVSLTLLMAMIAILHHPSVALSAWVVGGGLIAASGLPFSLAIRRLSAIQLFLIPCFIILPFTASGETVNMGLFSIRWQGAVLAVTLYLRAVAMVMVSMVLLYTTSMSLLLRAAEALYLPRVLIQIALLTYRYIFTLAHELTNMRWALATRGFRSGMNWNTYRIVANMVGMTLVRSFERTDRIYRAMHCRGYRGSIMTLHHFCTRWPDLGKSAICLAVSIALFYLDRL